MKLLALALVAAACGSPSGRPIDGAGGGGGGGGGDSGGGGDGSGSGQTSIYAHTGTDLYRVDPDTYATTHVGSFDCLTLPGDAMTDLGIDKDGNLVGVSFFTVATINPMTAHCTTLSSNLATQFNGLSFVPASALGQTGDDVLVGTDSTDGNVYQVNPMTGATTQIGAMGGSFMSSGDLVSVDNFGTVQTVPGATHDVLVRLAPMTFAATAIGTNTGFDMIWGLGFWKNKVFGFTNGGQIITIDPTTGAGTVVSSGGPGWYGAAVTTVAPVIQ
ncbi:MAG TPA: hypothetical protein VGF94_08605 [Kofleriaceae bacterium]|jgi:hypothetical protein